MCGMVRTGLDVLLQTPDHDVRKFLAGKRVGLVTNYASFASDGRRNIEALVAERVCESLVVFGPEHGYWSDGQYMDGSEDESYGERCAHEPCARKFQAYFAGGATIASFWPLRASAAATKPLAFCSSTNLRRYSAPRSRSFGVAIACSMPPSRIT